MLNSLLNHFQVPPELQKRRVENDIAWYQLRDSINRSEREQTTRLRLLTELQRNGNMQLAQYIQNEREKLLKQ